jgi:hypothetical protein
LIGEEISVEGWQTELKGSDDVSEVALERRPGESEKDTLTPSKASQAEGGMGQPFEPITIGRSALVVGKTFVQL